MTPLLTFALLSVEMEILILARNVRTSELLMAAIACVELNVVGLVLRLKGALLHVVMEN